DRMTLRLTGLEELGDTRQTAGDVLGLRGLARDLGEDISGLDLLPIGHLDIGAHGEEVAREIVAARLDRLVRARLLDADARTGARITRLDDIGLGETSHLVERLLHGDALDDIAELHDAADLGEDRVGVRIPLGKDGARLDLLALFDGNE